MNYKEFYNDSAFELIMWSLKFNKIKKNKIIKIANEMEHKYRKHHGIPKNRKPKNIED